MDIKKNNVPNNTVTRKLTDIDAQTGNIYESVVVISRRANQIATQLKQELNRKLADFSSTTDTLEETFENREQIEISRYYERLPKPTLIATEEFLEGEVYFRNATPETEQQSPPASGACGRTDPLPSCGRKYGMYTPPSVRHSPMNPCFQENTYCWA